ncbi:MAG: PIN domain-containing protein [Chloroflexi bacterium]|nr:PIN domain-containing protein [Chloroflexota bacterium]
MGSIDQWLARHATVGLDTSIFIYHFEAHPKYLPLTTTILNSIESGKQHGVTSIITLMELTVQPWKLNKREVAQQYEGLLAYFPNLTLADTTRDIVRQAAQLRAQYNLRSVDALQIATGLAHNATAFVTNDRQWKRLASRLDILILDDLV